MILEYSPTSQTSSIESRIACKATCRTNNNEHLTKSKERNTENRPKLEQWNSEQIRDFVKKLGFLETEKEEGEKIKHFRQISAVS